MSYPYAYSRTSNYYPVWRPFMGLSAGDWACRYMVEDLSKYARDETTLFFYARVVFWTC